MIMEEAIVKAADAVLCLMERGIDIAMGEYNTKTKEYVICSKGYGTLNFILDEDFNVKRYFTRDRNSGYYDDTWKLVVPYDLQNMKNGVINDDNI